MANTLDNLIRLTNAGLSIANFAQIKTALINEYKAVYGTDIDVDDTTADGVYLNNLSLMINNMLQTMGTIYDNLDIKSASGSQLDILCALSNIKRKPATYSNATIVLTYLGNTTATYTPDDLVFIDNAQVEWVATKNYTFSTSAAEQSVYVECRKLGPVTAPAGWINKLIDATLPFTISQTSAANIGQNEESDYSLRARQTSSGSGVGVTVQSALESQLRSIAGIEDVKLVNNYTDSASTLSDAAVVQPHSIYPVIRLQTGVTVLDETIGKLIYSKLTPGISCNATMTNVTNGTAKSYENVTTVNGIATSSLDRQIVKWKQATGIHADFIVELNTYSFFSTSEIPKIGAYMMKYLNALPIGTIPTDNDLLIQLIAADPKFKGNATYYVEEITFRASNPFTFYDYTTTTIYIDEIDPTICTITIS